MSLPVDLNTPTGANLLSDRNGVGALFISTETERVLLNLRADHKSHAECWALWGGMLENDETPKEALLRELSEEMGFMPDIDKIYPFDVYHSNDGHFKYFSFVCITKYEFLPILNEESSGYAWFNLGTWPKPMHQGAKASFCNKKSTDRLRTILRDYRVLPTLDSNTISKSLHV